MAGMVELLDDDLIDINGGQITYTWNGETGSIGINGNNPFILVNKDDFVTYYNTHIGTDCDGAGYGIKLKDEYGGLTLNNGIVKTEDGRISCTIDIRVPVTFTPNQMRELVSPYLEDDKGVTLIDHISESLFYPPDSPLVTALYNAYVQVTGDTETRPMVIGGGTYAKSIPGIIAFGCKFPVFEDHIHDANEQLLITDLQRQVEIYIQAVKNLLA